MNLIRNIALASAAIFAFAGMTLTAQAESTTKVTAEPVAQTQQATVNFSDLNLNSAEGQETLYYRISNAAKQVCGSQDVRQAGGVAQAARNEDCYQQSLSRALAEVNNSAVASTN